MSRSTPWIRWTAPLFAAALALPLLAQPGLPEAAEPRASAGPELAGAPLRLVGRYLQLSEQQIEQTKQLAQAAREQHRPLREQREALRGELAKQLEAPTPNTQAIGSLMVQLHELRSEGKTAREAFVADFVALLTPEQAAKFETLRGFREFLREARRQRGAKPASAG